MTSYSGIKAAPTDAGEYLATVFGADGVLAKTKPGYVPRPEQIELAHAVHQTFTDRRTLLAEAPTGVGKSFGYAVPASWHAAHQHRRVVIVTANIALQEQLVEKDLPFLAEHLPWKFSFALAKGWSNYLCRDAMTDSRNDHLRGRRLPVLQDQENLERAFKWADQTVDGDVSELPFELNQTLRPLLTVSTEDCLRKACDHYLDCHARKAREALGSAQLLVANYHMYFTDLALRASSGKESGILPEHQLVVLDEGHKASTIARDFFGQRITPGAVRHAASALDAKGKLTEKLGLPKQIEPELKNDLSFAADKLFAELGALRQDESRYKNRIDRQGMFDATHLMALLDSARARYEQAAGGGNISGEGRVYLHARAARCEVLGATLRNAMVNANADDWVYFLDDIAGREGAVALMAVPFSVADVLRPVLFEREPEPAQGVVVTSATLCTSSGKSAFDFTASQLGAERADELVVASPFDFSRSCLVIPRITPPTEDARAWLSDVCDQFVEATTMAGGRTLGLFTSYKALRAAKARLLDTRPNFTVLAQGDAPRTQLLQRFRDDETSVLLGCESFWEGVDAPGITCSLVFIDRIPFDHFEDPIVDAIRARDRQWFMSYMVPRAITMFRQGFGRLVRSVTDGGVVVCCDTRLVDKAYGRQFLRALPAGVTTFRRLEQASGYLSTPF